MKCPVTTLRSWLEKPIERISKLPVARGFPVPWFVAWVKGEPEFRAMDSHKFVKAIRKRLCWCCGEPLGYNATFVIGPMCAINRTSAEPPSHPECAKWSARNCPFLTQRQLERREDEFTAKLKSAGMAIKRNPGVCLLWTTPDWRTFSDGRGGVLIKFGDPISTEWFREGRPATRQEVLRSVETGYPILASAAAQDGPDAMAELASLRDAAEKYYPPLEIVV